MKQIFSLFVALWSITALGQTTVGIPNNVPLCRDFKVNIVKTSQPTQREGCCYSISIINNYNGSPMFRPTSFRVKVNNASIISSIGTPNGWNKTPAIIPPNTNNLAWRKASGSIPTGQTNLGTICFGNVSTDPFYLTYEWLDLQTRVICKDSTIIKCDTSSLDLTGCDVDIDTTIVTVSCGNIVNVKPIFDGTPSSIKYTIYDSAGNIILSASNISQYTFTLPGYGIFYGVVEVSCGGGDDHGGDQDEEAFEIINSAPIADFFLNSKCNCAAGKAQRTITTTDNSQEEGLLTYAWKVKDISTGIITTYNVAEPTYILAANKQYNVELTVQDQKGCSSYKSVLVQSVATCKSKYNWWYSWCEHCNDTSHVNVNVNFQNQSEYSNCSSTAKYSWDFGDGGTSTVQDPIHTYIHLPCAGSSFTVTLTTTLGNAGDSDYCQSTWDTVITISNEIPSVGVRKICCDGLVFFYTDAVKGKWSTPGSLGIPKWPAVSKKIWRPFWIQVGQNYRQYYNSSPNPYFVTVNGAETEDHNRCPVLKVEFWVTNVDCFNRNAKRVVTDNVGGVSVKYKLRALALPWIHRMKSKIKTIGFKKAAIISTDFAGQINKKDADGCYCAPQNISASSGTITNKRKAKAATTTSGKFRIGVDKVTANFYIKTKNGATGTYTLKLGLTPCSHPWFLFF